MKSILLTLLFVLCTFSLVFAQELETFDFYKKSNQINTTGMYVLGGWAVANIAGGAVGWSNSTGSTKYFHQMNLFWNTVNLGIAGFALYNNLTDDFSMLSSNEMLLKHRKTENLYLINAGLDVVYIGTGFLLKHLSVSNLNKQDLLKGYGNSIILQGGFGFGNSKLTISVKASIAGGATTASGLVFAIIIPRIAAIIGSFAIPF